MEAAEGNQISWIFRFFRLPTFPLIVRLNADRLFPPDDAGAPKGKAMADLIHCVIYDCDGVLFDSLEANRRLYNLISLSSGRGPLTEDELQYCHMHTVQDSIHCLFKEDPEGEPGPSNS